MSLALTSESSEDCEAGGFLPSERPLPSQSQVSFPFLAAAGSSLSSSGSLDTEGSYDEDRPLSRLTIIESPSSEFDQECEEAELESPDQEEDYCEGRYLSSGQGGRGPVVYSCEDCDKTFASPGKLRQHEYTHTGETPFECSIQGCDKKFTSKFKLKRHILIHSQTKTFLCDVCHRAFRRKDHLKNHEKVHDPGKTVYSCSYEACGRTYNSLSSFRKHQAMHCAEEGQLDCKICKLVLSTRDELINHLKIHAGSRSVKGTMDKKFMCNQCDKKFFTRKDLKRHSVVHTGNREFCCPHCSQRFGRKDHMTRHAKKTHPSFYPEGVSVGGRGERTRYVSSPGKTPGRPVRTQRKERSISDPGPLRIPDPKKVAKEEPEEGSSSSSSKTLIGHPRHVIVHHSSSRGATELDTHYSYSGGSVTYCEDSAPCVPRRTFGEDSGYTLPDMAHPSPETDFQGIQGPAEFQQMNSPDDFQRTIQSPTELTRLTHMSLENSEMIIKEEDPYYDDQESPEEHAIRELFEGKDRLDLGSLMNEFGDSKRSFLLSPEESSKFEFGDTRKTYLSPSSPDDDASLMTTTMETDIKTEPRSPLPTLDPHMIKEEYPRHQYHGYPENNPGYHNDRVIQNITQQQGVISEEEAEDMTSEAGLLPLQPLSSQQGQPQPVAMEVAKPRTVFIRTPSQDSITRTKNPVLPSIHTESRLVVPEPNSHKYPGHNTGPGHVLSGHTLLFAGIATETEAGEMPGEARVETDTLTELRGSLFLSDEYGQAYFQPWN